MKQFLAHIYEQAFANKHVAGNCAHNILRIMKAKAYIPIMMENIYGNHQRRRRRLQCKYEMCTNKQTSKRGYIIEFLCARKRRFSNTHKKKNTIAAHEENSCGFPSGLFYRKCWPNVFINRARS